MRDTGEVQGQDRRLDTWKEIAAYFGRDVRTAKRWERQRGLPVRRLPGGGGQVYAYESELAAWLRTADAEPDRPPASPQPRRRSWPLAALGVLILLAILAGGGWLLGRRQPPSAASATAASRIAHRPDPQAQRLYLKGLYEWNSRTPEGLSQAVDDFTQSIVRDPQYARPYAGLADAYNLLREYTAMPAEIAYPKAKAAAERAIALDDGLADAHSALAFVDYFWTWDASAAEREFRRAIELDPRSATAHHWYATALAHMGRTSDALAEIRKAEALQPESASIHADENLLLVKAGRTDEAVTLLRQMVQTDPAFQSPHRYLLEAYMMQCDWPAYMGELHALARLRRDRLSLAELDAAERALRASGEQAMFRSLAASAQRRYDAGRLSAFELARAYARARDKARMLPPLRAAIAGHDPDAVSLGVDPSFGAFAGDPDFQAAAAPIRAIGPLKERPACWRTPSV